MPRPWTDTTPVSADRWNCTCEQPEGHLVCPTHGKWPVKHDTQTGPRGGQAHANPLFPNALEPAKELNAEHDRADPRVAELAETCRVLAELAQQLTNAMQHVAHRHSYYPLEVREALAAAAELGITPKP